MQPVDFDGKPQPSSPRGVIRFKPNAIVQWLLDNGGKDLNDIARQNFSDDDRMQFAQLIGYSVSGWGDLSYVSEAAIAAADERAEAVWSSE
jgi:hypothetical protein